MTQVAKPARGRFAKTAAGANGTIAGNILALLKGLLDLTLDTLLPPQCVACRAPVAELGRLCGACWRGVNFIAGPMCRCCGFPFDFDQGPDTLCGACVNRERWFTRARAVMKYDDHSKGLILSFKHGDRLEAAPSYGAWMGRAGAELLQQADLLVPVPLHRWRLFGRRYNQSAVLAHGIGRAIARTRALPVAADLLVRTRMTPSQAGLSRKARALNVRGAFQVRKGRRGLLAGKRIVLVDDVLTTGATVEACARALLRAGAVQVDVLVLARVVRPEQLLI